VKGAEETVNGEPVTAVYIDVPLMTESPMPQSVSGGVTVMEASLTAVMTPEAAPPSVTVSPTRKPSVWQLVMVRVVEPAGVAL
jgi:hypothetical protein